MNQSNSIELQINDEFKNLIPPLSYNEYAQLEESIKNDNCLMPIIVWGNKNIIVDGHNRYAICKKNNLSFNIIRNEFSSDIEVKSWIIKNQIGRRNLNNFQKSFLVLKYQELFLSKGLKKKLSCLKQYQSSENQISDERAGIEINTNREIGLIVGLSHETISRVRTLLKKADSDTISKLHASKCSINSAYTELIEKERLEKERLEKEIANSKNKNKMVNQSNIQYDIIYYKSKICPSRENSLLIKTKLKQDGALFFWSDSCLLSENITKIKKLGFTIVRNYFWFNDKFQNKMNILILAKKGNPNIPDDKNSILYCKDDLPSHMFPEYYYNLIENIFPNMKYYEINHGDLESFNNKWTTKYGERYNSIVKKVA
ncbi:MAG: ParB/RepB/Spo0J family partition protein [Bacteroidetes bacterium]|nr:ParB/RepB/Spo0J family partition protein [Bacteroidota bacterium]